MSMVNHDDAREGLRVLRSDGEPGTVIHVFTGSMAGAVEVEWDDGSRSIERAYKLRDVLPLPLSPGYPGEPPDWLDWSEWYALNNID